MMMAKVKSSMMMMRALMLIDESTHNACISSQNPSFLVGYLLLSHSYSYSFLFLLN